MRTSYRVLICGPLEECPIFNFFWPFFLWPLIYSYHFVNASKCILSLDDRNCDICIFLHDKSIQEWSHFNTCNLFWLGSCSKNHIQRDETHSSRYKYSFRCWKLSPRPCTSNSFQTLRQFIDELLNHTELPVKFRPNVNFYPSPPRNTLSP